MSQRACVFCGSRVVLYPIADALHLAENITKLAPLALAGSKLGLDLLEPSGAAVDPTKLVSVDTLASKAAGTVGEIEKDFDDAALSRCGSRWRVSGASRRPWASSKAFKT